MLVNQPGGNKTIITKNSLFSCVLKSLSLRKKTAQITEKTNSEDAEIIECLKKARNDWTNACKDFEYAEDQDLIDYHTYRIKAYQLRYEYFLKKAKEKGLKSNFIEENSLIHETNTKI